MQFICCKQVGVDGHGELWDKPVFTGDMVFYRRVHSVVFRWSEVGICDCFVG